MSLIGSILHRILDRTPYDLRRRQVVPVLPPGKLENVQLALAYYLAAKTNPTFVQIGACDGVSGDPTQEFVKCGEMRAVLVEPIDTSFDKLAALHANTPNVAIVRAAIASEDGEATLYKAKDGAQSIDPYWSTQLASFDMRHLLKHGLAPADIVAVKVPALTLSSLMAKCGLEHIDILQVDAEGFDGEIVKMALNLVRPPECLHFEHLHLGAVDRTEVFSLLEQHRYEWMHDQWNTLAIHESWKRRWSDGSLHCTSSL